MKRRSQILHSEKPWWTNMEPNFARLQMAVQRGAVIFGKDHVKILKNYEEKKHENNEQK